MADKPAPMTPFVRPEENIPEFTLAPIVLGSLLGIIFGASSMYLVLKVGLTTSASIPVAVISFALFRVMSSALGFRKRTILENNIVQTAGSAGESIAFGVGLVMPALLTLGFEIDAIRVMTVGVFGGLLGILMMIPLRKVFIVEKHHELKYPEGTACADVLKAGEQGGSTAVTLVIGLVIGFVFQLLVLPFKLLKETAELALSWTSAAGKTVGLKGASLSSEISAPLLGVGYIIGPRVAGIMVAGGVLAYLVIGPLIVKFGSDQRSYIEPAKPAWVLKIADEADHVDATLIAATGFPITQTDKGRIENMSESLVRKHYILFVGAGAVAAGGIISMLRAMPVIFGSVVAGIRDLTGRKSGEAVATKLRTEKDMPFAIVIFGSLGMIVALMAAPSLGLGFNLGGVVGAVMILLFGFLFVIVSSRLTGEIGSSSNPISGMTVCTLLITCLILLGLAHYGYIENNQGIQLLALTIAGIVCIASSNGGTTSQALKTGHLLGATPKYQQYAILIGSLTSAVVVGLVLILFNTAGTVYSKQNLPKATVDVSKLTIKEKVAIGEYVSDTTLYSVLHFDKDDTEKVKLIKTGNPEEIPTGKYYIADDGTFQYSVDPAVTGTRNEYDNGTKVMFKFEAPKTQLVTNIIKGILKGNLPWDLVTIGIIIAIMLELCGLPSLAFAVGVYLPLSSSMPIFIGGLLRLLVDKFRNRPEEGDSSPGVLLSSGYIAGGSIAALIAAGLAMSPDALKAVDLGAKLFNWKEPESDLHVAIGFGALAVFLLIYGVLAGRKPK